jgi:hypothetical protein
MAGYLSQACGAIFTGFYIKFMVSHFGSTIVSATTNIVQFYALLGACKAIGYYMMNENHIEAKKV